MKISLFKRIICGILVVIMLAGVVLGALSTAASAAEIVKKTGIQVASQPKLTFYDIDGNQIGTFSHAASSDLIGFTASKVMYYNEEGNSVEETYSRADATMYFVDKSIKFSSLTKARMSSYYFKYEMGSSKGGVLANNMRFHEDDDGYVAFDAKIDNIVFRDANKMKWTVTYQRSVLNKTTDKNMLKTTNVTGTFTFTKAKLESLIGKETTPKRKTDTSSGITDANTGTDVSKGVSYEDGENDTSDDSGDKDNTNNNDNSSSGGGSTTPPVSTAGIETPYLILDSFTAHESGQVIAGSGFPLNFTCRNTSAQIDLENIIVKLTTAEGLQIADSTNTFYIPILSRSGTFEQNINLTALPNAEAKSYPIDLSFSYEYVVNDSRQKGEMSQQIAIPVVQQDRFSVDPVGEIMESVVGEEIDITGKYVNKSRGEVFNVSATLTGDYAGSGQIHHVGNVAAGVSGEVEFTITPDKEGDLIGSILYTYEDAMGNAKSVSVPFSTKISASPDDDMMGGGMIDSGMGGMYDEFGNPIDPDAEMQGEKNVVATFLENMKNPNSWELWAVVGGVVLIVVLIVGRILHKRKLAKEFEEDDEAI